MNLESYIRDVNDFPKKGVLFKDITPLLASPKATKLAVDIFVKALNSVKIDKVVGMESRGFLLGILLAQELNAGFVPVRKPGKLPYEKLSQTYNLEYATDTLEIHKDAIEKGEKVLIHDDVLATGGTAAATCQLVERLGGKIVQINFLIELGFLEGIKKLSSYQVTSLLKY